MLLNIVLFFFIRGVTPYDKDKSIIYYNTETSSETSSKPYPFAHNQASLFISCHKESLLEAKPNIVVCTCTNYILY